MEPVPAPVQEQRSSDVGGARRFAILAGLRTPFAAPEGVFRTLRASDLGKLLVHELLARADVDPQRIEACIVGQALPAPGRFELGTLARAIQFGADLNPRGDAFDVSRGGLSGLQALVSAAEAIQGGRFSVAIVAGVDSTTEASGGFSFPWSRALSEAKKVRSLGQGLQVLSSFSSGVGFPSALGAGGLGEDVATRGEGLEQWARRLGLGRIEQDVYAVRSHEKAHQAWKEGRFEGECMHVLAGDGFGVPVTKDGFLKDSPSLPEFAARKPLFDARFGTVTDATVCSLADGAAALLVVREDDAAALGLKPLGFLTSWAFASLDPRKGAEQGPSAVVEATRLALERGNVAPKSVGVVELHEASSVEALAQRAQLEALGLGGSCEPGSSDVGWNSAGGTLALGHPPAATGLRLVLSAIHALMRRGGGSGLVAMGVEMGVGGALVVEVDP